MKPEEQRIAIAEACGWKFVVNPVTQIGGYWEKGQQGESGYERGDWGSRECAVGIPDYLNDLNGMHEAEKVLTEDQYDRYCYNILMAENSMNLSTPEAICATAAQRAEACLRTLGKWT